MCTVYSHCVCHCVQFDALIDDMTAYELLWMYARLRGIPEKKIKNVVDMEIERLDLLNHAKNYCGTYRCAWLLMLH